MALMSAARQCPTISSACRPLQWYSTQEGLQQSPTDAHIDLCRSLGLTLLEAATGRYPYDASGGPLELMIQARRLSLPCQL